MIIKHLTIRISRRHLVHAGKDATTLSPGQVRRVHQVCHQRRRRRCQRLRGTEDHYRALESSVHTGRPTRHVYVSRVGYMWFIYWLCMWFTYVILSVLYLLIVYTIYLLIVPFDGFIVSLWAGNWCAREFIVGRWPIVASCFRILLCCWHCSRSKNDGNVVSLCENFV